MGKELLQPAAAQQFLTTNWSVVLAAGGTNSMESRDALARLCERYWYPLYAYVRRAGYNAEDAADLTQAFFLQLLETQAVRAADRGRGRFRSFLLASLRNFLSNEWDRARALKRGGAHERISLDTSAAETRYAREQAHDLSPERLYERRWALLLVDSALGELRKQLADEGRLELYERLKSFMTGHETDSTYRQVGDEMGMSEEAVKSAVYRLRKRFGVVIRGQIAHTVSSAEQVEDELKDLFTALQS
jgi:RNA polymerase sigma factor (sigma-70 family)